MARIPKDRIAGVILAGGRSSRMGGGDKSLLPLGGKPIIAHVIARMKPQVGPLIINANSDANRFAAFGYPVIADTIPGFAGPLAGVLTGMDWAAGAGASWIATVATDTPFLPDDLVARLGASIGDASIAIASSDGRQHPVFGLFPVALAGDLRRFLEAGARKVSHWLGGQFTSTVEFELEDGRDPFFNVNTPADLAEAARCLLEPPLR